MEEHKNKSLSPGTALILGLSGIVIAAIVVGGAIAWKALDKVENQQELIDLICKNLEKDPRNEISCDR
jgi:hypothetical protein